MTFGESVMMSVAGKTAPLTLVFTGSSNRSSLMGTGDIIFPGLMMNMFMRFDGFHGTNLFSWAFSGYIIGLIITSMMAFLFETAQPALLWIFPLVLGLPMGRAWYQGIFGDLWRDGGNNPEPGTNEELAEFRRDLLEATRGSDVQVSSGPSEQSEERAESNGNGSEKRDEKEDEVAEHGND
jgi:hypothetical protein